MRSHAALSALLVLGAALTGCASSRIQRADASARTASRPVPSDTARVGLAATMTIPDNPYGDSADVAIPAPEDIASGAVPLATPAEGAVDPSQVTVSRYYYQDEGTYYYEDVADDLDDYAQGDDDDVYYGGYYASYYRYGDPAYYPSPYTYYRPYGTYRPYVRYGWYPTWRHRRAWVRSAHYAGWAYYDPYYGWGYYDPYTYGPGVYVSIGWGWGGYGSYGAGYRDGFYDGAYGGYHGGYASSGYYGPGYYGRPRHRGYDDWRDAGRDDGRRGRVRGLPGTPVAVQSGSDPARQPARRGLAPARLPRGDDGGITRSTGRRLPPSVRPETPTRVPRATRIGDDPSRTGRSTTMPSRTGRSTSGRTEAPAPRRTTRQLPGRTEAPARTEAPRRTRRDAPARTEAPRRDTRSERRESRPAPPPRRESRPAPPPRRESRPAPPPRRESSPAPRRGGNDRPSRSRRGGDND